MRGSPVRTQRSGARKWTLASVRPQMCAQLSLRCKGCSASRESAWKRLTTNMRRQVRREETVPLKHKAAVSKWVWKSGSEGHTFRAFVPPKQTFFSFFWFGSCIWPFLTMQRAFRVAARVPKMARSMGGGGHGHAPPQVRPPSLARAGSPSPQRARPRSRGTL